MPKPYRLNVIVGFLALLTASLPAVAQAPAAATISLRSDADLAFGSIAPGPAGGSVTITPVGARTSTGVILLGGGFGGASYTVTIGGGNPHFTITLPSSVTLQAPSGATMTVDSFLSDPFGGGKVDPPQRTGKIAVGGTLRVGANQPAGSYSAPFLVTVNLGN